ncbi:MAG: hypothetical protein JXA07_13090 [Spirochaetes bacterium]|nr:hypothetical protein [Spirochaetota bacterium]
MKKHLLLLIAVLLIGTAPVAVFANHLENPGLRIDCDVFTITVSGATWNCAGEVKYTLILTPQNGGEAITIEGVFDVPGELGPVLKSFENVEFTGELGTIPCGEYTVTGSAQLMCSFYDTFSIDLPATTLVCGCTYDFDPRTPGYWKNHPEMWVAEAGLTAPMMLTIGGVEYTQEQLLGMLNTPVRGDAKVIMIKHLIAAKLNVLSGGDPGIQTSIDAADACLINGCNKKDMLSIKDALDTYNNLNLE